MSFSNMDIDTVPDYPTLATLKGKHALVFGGGNGIGRQTSHMLAQFGASVSVVDLELEKASRVANEINGDAWKADVTSEEETIQLVREVTAKHTHIDIVVDIVGMSMFAYLQDMEQSDWKRMIDVNLTQAFNVMKAVKLAHHGDPSRPTSLIFVSSVSGFKGAQRHAAYGAAKAGLIALVKSAAVEFGNMGIRVNSVAPGTTWTERISNALGEQRYDDWAKDTPLGRLGQTRDIASAIYFFASDLSVYVSGQTLAVDGGRQVRFEYDVDGI